MSAVRGFGEHPGRIRLEADLVQERRELDARPLRAADHSMVELEGIELGGSPLHAAIGGAFDEMNSRYRWESLDIFHREQEGSLHQTVDQEPVLGRIDQRQASVITLEKQPVGRDDSGLMLQWREGDALNPTIWRKSSLASGARA